MRTCFIAFCSAAASLACLAADISDGINSLAARTLIPTGDVSAVVSPYALAFTAGFLGDGMDNRELRIELGEKLGLRTTDFAPTFDRVNEWLRDLAASNRVEFLLANSVWMRNYTRVLPDFHEMAHRDYGIVFGPLVGIDPINAWTSVKTGGLVEKVVDEIDLSSDTVIVSAVAFNGPWERPFPKAEQGVFHAPGGDVHVPVMRDVRSVRTLRRPGYSAFALPYRGGRLFLYVLIPEAGGRPHDIGLTLSSEELDLLDRALLPGYRPEDERGEPMPDVEGSWAGVARMSMPKFRVETSADCVPALVGLGLQRSGYDAICKGMSIGSAVQHVVFEASETGGEVGLVELPAVKAEGEVREIVCDRPFAFLVRTADRLTLVAGRYLGR